MHESEISSKKRFYLYLLQVIFFNICTNNKLIVRNNIFSVFITAGGNVFILKMDNRDQLKCRAERWIRTECVRMNGYIRIQVICTASRLTGHIINITVKFPYNMD